jgi:threonine dehydratase
VTELVTLDEIRAAAERLRPVLQHTPTEVSRAISHAAGVRTLLKCEHLQRTGSFKMRGAYNHIAQLTAEEAGRGVVCSSAGNHAQGVALSAQLAGVSARVYMPARAPLPKVQATRGYGAEVVLTGETYDDAYAAARDDMATSGATFVHPFDHPAVIAGQGTLGVEVLDEVPEAGSVVVPVGGGGLVSGVASAVKALRPQAKVVGVQAAGAASFPASLAAGHVVALDRVTSFADGIAVKRPGELTLAHVRDRVDEVVTVSDEAIARAVLFLVERAKQVVEPAGAAGLAAVLEGATALPEPVVVVLCGGNVDPLLLVRIIQSGMFEEGRYFIFRTRLHDQPGALSRLLGLIGDQGANVIGIEHHRLGTRLGVLEVEVACEVETRGGDHIRALVEDLTAAGYPISEDIPATR